MGCAKFWGSRACGRPVVDPRPGSLWPLWRDARPVQDPCGLCGGIPCAGSLWPLWWDPRPVRDPCGLWRDPRRQARPRRAGSLQGSPRDPGPRDPPGILGSLQGSLQPAGISQGSRAQGSPGIPAGIPPGSLAGLQRDPWPVADQLCQATNQENSKDS